MLASCAAVIASQALITAAFSVTKQAIQLGYLPRLRILHTSILETGQVFVPFVNWGLYAGVVIAVVFFGSSDNLGAAYGITVTIDMLITTTMTFFVVRYAWKFPWIVALGATGFFFIVDFTYLAANVVKVIDGGWFPLLIGAFMPAMPTKPRKLGYKEQRELDALPARIEALEREQKDLAALLASAELYAEDPVRAEAVQMRYAQIDDELLVALERWVALAS